MSHGEAVSQWKKTVSTSFGHLSGPQARGLALWSFGMVLAKSCGITSVVGLLAPLVENSESKLRQQLREWCYDATDKKGAQRQQIDVELCFAPLLCWIVSWWPVDEPRLALAMDASNLTDRFTVLCLSVMYRGCAIPVAWKIIVGNAPGSWEPYWKSLFSAIHSSVPADWTVIVLADRGLYAKWLYEHLVSLGWHPFLRINVRGKVRPEGEEAFRWLCSLVPVAGSSWAGAVECFVDKPKRLSCTLLACYEAGYADPWLIVTDLPANAANVVWYSMRTWIEAGFKDTKRGGWQWHHTKMTDPARASRLWLAIAVATLWAVSVGGEADATLPCSGLADLPELHVARTQRKTTQRSRPRLRSCFARGLQLILVALLKGEPVPLGRFIQNLGRRCFLHPSTRKPRLSNRNPSTKKARKRSGRTRAFPWLPRRPHENTYP